MDVVATPGAVCPAHPEQPLAFACARCGAFACEACRSGRERNLCPACAQRIEALSLSVWDAVRDGVRLGLRAVPSLLPVLLIAAVLRVALAELEHLLPHAALGHHGLKAILTAYATGAVKVLAVTWLQTPFQAAVDAFSILRVADLHEGRDRPLGALTTTVKQRFAAAVLAYFLASTADGVGTILCCLPALFVAPLFAFIEIDVLLGGSSPLAAFRRSRALAGKVYWRLVLLMGLATAIMLLLAVLARRLAHALGVAPGLDAVAGSALSVAPDVLIGFAVDASLTVLYLRLRDRREMVPQPGL